MKTLFLHILYFIVLIILSFASFFIILGAGFTGKINVFVLFIPLIFSIIWLSDYTWRFLSLKSAPNKIQLIHPVRNWAFISWFLSGVFIVYSLFLTTLLPTPTEVAPVWIFLGTSIILLLIWYGSLYRQEISNKRNQILNSLLLLLSGLYTYQVVRFYMMQLF